MKQQKYKGRRAGTPALRERPAGRGKEGGMFYREVTGVQFSAGDMCRGCERFPEPGQRPCQAVQQFLPALRRGLHLEVLYCPDFHPPLGKEKGT